MGSVAVGVLAVVVFIPAFSAGFVWDDVIIVDFLEQGIGLSDTWLNPSRIESEGHYWPVVYTTFWVEHMLWGLDPVGYHVVNVVLHAANSMLVFALLRRLGLPGAWFAAALFAVHPMHVDSVVWAIERKDVLSALFYLLAALAYLHSDELRRDVDPPRRHAARRRRRLGRGEALYVASLAAFTLGLLSKSIVVTLPVVLLVYHWWRNGRVARREFIRTVPFFAVSVVVTLGDLAYYTTRESRSLDISLLERAQIMARSTWHYVHKLVWPADLLPIYPLWDVDGGDLVGWAIVVGAVAVVVGLWLLRHRIGRGALAGVLFFGVTLAPVSGIVDFGYMDTSYVADRFQYLAGIGLIALVVGSAACAAARLRGGAGHRLSGTRVLAGLCVPVVVVSGVLTWRAALNYESPERFFTHIVTNNPTARGGAYGNLGHAYRELGRTEDAIEMYEQSLVNDAPNVYGPLYSLGVLYVDLDEVDTAESYFRQSLELRPSYVPAMGYLVVLLANRSEFGEAEALALKALRLKPHWADVHNNAAVMYEKSGDLERAEEYFNRGIELHPDDESLLANYGLFLHKNDRLVEAEPILRRALEADPQRQDLAQSLANVLVVQGRNDEAAELVEEGYVEEGYIETLAPSVAIAEVERSVAIAEVERGNVLLEADRYDQAAEAYEAAIVADPDYLAAHVQLGVALENLDRPEQALSSYRHAYEINDENISAVYFLGLLSARLGHNDEALRLFDEAARLFDQGLVPTATPGTELPDLADVYLNRAVVNVGLDRLDDALADTERALELDPSLELAAVNREQILGMISLRDQQAE